jgi:hypothetical protein
MKHYEIRHAIENANGAHKRIDYNKFYVNDYDLLAEDDSDAIRKAEKLQAEHESKIAEDLKDESWQSNAPAYSQNLYQRNEDGSYRKIEL